MAARYAIFTLALLVPIVAAEAEPEDTGCDFLDGPFLLTEAGIQPRDWPEHLNYAVISLLDYDACFGIDSRGLAAANAAIDVEDGGYVGGTPDEWQSLPGYSLNAFLPSSQLPSAGTVNADCYLGNPSSDCELGGPDPIFYSIPSVGANKPTYDCQASHMIKATEVIRDTFYVGALWACLGNAWQYQNGGPWNYQTSHGDPRDALETHFEDNLQLNGQWRYAMGWVRSYSNNGIAGGSVALGAEKASGVDWAHYIIAIHELGHLFGADDKGRWCNQGYGVMNECHAYWKYTTFDRDSLIKICDHFKTCYVPAI